MKGVCERRRPACSHGRPCPSWLQPRARPSSRGLWLHTSPPPSSLSWRDCRPSASREPPLEGTPNRNMFTGLDAPSLPPTPPAVCHSPRKKDSRSTLSSTTSPRDHTLYLDGGKRERCLFLNVFFSTAFEFAKLVRELYKNMTKHCRNSTTLFTLWGCCASPGTAARVGRKGVVG